MIIYSIDSLVQLMSDVICIMVDVGERIHFGIAREVPTLLLSCKVGHIVGYNHPFLNGSGLTVGF